VETVWLLGSGVIIISTFFYARKRKTILPFSHYKNVISSLERLYFESNVKITGNSIHLNFSEDELQKLNSEKLQIDALNSKKEANRNIDTRSKFPKQTRKKVKYGTKPKI